MKKNFYVEIPNNVTIMEENLVWSESKPDYLKHQAYADFIKSASFFQKIASLLLFIKSSLLLILKRVTQYERINYDLRKPKSISALFMLLNKLILNIFRLDSLNLKPHSETEISQILEKYGCCVLTLDDHSFSIIEEASTQDFNKLSSKRQDSVSAEQREFNESRAVSSFDSKLYKTINQVWSDMGITKAVSKHLNKRSRLIDVNPQINDKSDSFWNNIFPDMGVKELPLSAYFHRDASGGDLKAILYMSNVGDLNGPFSYVLGSHKIQTSKIDDFIMEANDNNGLSSTESIKRKLFSALPAKLQQKGSFGNDLYDKDFLSKSIQKSAWSITAPKGSLIIFDTKGIHRGGMVKESERSVITTVIG
ncbi:hypothetical protein N9A69_01495 [Gammaproteobacteria bacterium]|nr:hypothetical protein [Gammaproteobacteria bacterium]